MKKLLIWVGVIFLLLVAVAWSPKFKSGSSSVQSPTNSADSQNAATVVRDPIWQQYDSSGLTRTFKPPLQNLATRQVKKPFGIYVTPQNSPIQPEHFTGYHTGADFEIFQDELNKDVPVYAICDGKFLLKKNGTGYGGYAVQSCELNGQPITVLYGHLRLSSISPNAGDAIKAGQQIALLGNAFSAETDGERKHLHLSIHKGPNIVPAGYVQRSQDLNQWIDPLATIQE